MKKINIDSWHRKEYFDFFSKYDDPFFGLVSEVNCTNAYKTAKDRKISFFAFYLHCSLLAVNDIKEFRYRIFDNEIVLFEEIHAATTIGRNDGSFGFSFVPFNRDFDKFNTDLQKEVREVRDTKDMRYLEESGRLDVIHYSSIPWRTFTGLKHPGNFSIKDSAPKIVFGKTFKRSNQLFMPVAVNAHHGFADGFHVSEFFELYEKYLKEC